jgi:hypothetical protein
MRLSPVALVALVCAASLSAAHAQTPSASLPRTPVSQAHSGMSISYDAENGQINTSGIQLSATPQAKTSAPPYTGTVIVTINIKIASDFRRGTLVHCSASAIGGELSTDNGLVAGGLETASGFARYTGGGSATCVLSMPFAWSLPRGIPADTGLVIAFGARAVNGPDRKEVLRSTFQVDGIAPLPTNGSTSNFTFDLTL